MKLKLINGYWVDENSNKWLASRYTKEQAYTASKSLKDCYYCINCYDCNICIYCTTCFNCDSCVYCISSIGCKDCEKCVDCNDCIGCIEFSNYNNHLNINNYIHDKKSKNYIKIIKPDKFCFIMFSCSCCNCEFFVEDYKCIDTVYKQRIGYEPYIGCKTKCPNCGRGITEIIKV